MKFSQQEKIALNPVGQTLALCKRKAVGKRSDQAKGSFAYDERRSANLKFCAADSVHLIQKLCGNYFI